MHLKTYIIRLSSSEISRKLADDCLIQASKLGYDVKYFEGINGKDSEIHYKTSGVIRPKKPIKKGRCGVLGCFFSHFYLWKKCIELKEAICVLEHDGFILREFKKEWLDGFNDICKLDGLDPFDLNYNKHIDSEINLNNFSILPYVNNLSKKSQTGNYFRGAYAYIIKPAGAQKLINYVLNNPDGHLSADQQIGSKILTLNYIKPSIARLHQFYSEGENITEFSHTKNDYLLENIKNT